MADQKSKLQKGKANFTIIGKAKVNDFTFKVNEKSDSGYLYSRLNLGVAVSETDTVYSEAMAGYFPSKDTTLYVRSKEDNKRFEISWEDRDNEEILKTVNDMDFIRIGIEKDVNDKLVVKKFLTWYDAIPYVQEVLRDETVVKVRGNLKFSKFGDKIQIKKEARSIYLADVTPDKFEATFVQTVLLDENSVDKSRVKEDKEFDIFAKVIDYSKEDNKQNVCYPLTMVLPIREDSPKLTESLITKFLKVKKGVRAIDVTGTIKEGTEVAQPTEADIPEDMQELIDMGIYTKEEILGKLVVKGDKVFKFILQKPDVKKNDKGNLIVPMDDDKYTIEDLVMVGSLSEQSNVAPSSDSNSSSSGETTEDDNSWLNDL